MIKTIKELQALEYALYQLLSIDDYYKIKFLCNLHGKLVECSSLIYMDNPYCPAIPPDYKNRFELTQLNLINYEELIKLIPFPKTFNLRNSLVNWLTKDPAYLLNLLLDIDFNSKFDENQLSKIPNRLNNIIFLDSNYKVPFIFVDQNEPITVLNIKITLNS